MTNKKFNKNYDVFRSFLVALPNCLITFSKAMTKKYKNYDRWVMFYEHDKNFERLWHNPKQYLNKLKKFNGIIAPDFSLYRNMPLVMQEWNTYRGRALSFWFQKNGIEIIPNIR